MKPATSWDWIFIIFCSMIICDYCSHMSAMAHHSHLYCLFNSLLRVTIKRTPTFRISGLFVREVYLWPSQRPPLNWRRKLFHIMTSLSCYCSPVFLHMWWRESISSAQHMFLSYEETVKRMWYIYVMEYTHDSHITFHASCPIFRSYGRPY